MAALEITVWVVSGLLALLYLMVGAMKVMSPAKAQAMGPTMAAQSPSKIRFIGVAEVLGAIGIIVPVAVDILPWVSGLAAVGLVAVQGFAIPEHIKHKDTQKLPMNIGLLLMAAFVALARFDVL